MKQHRTRRRNRKSQHDASTFDIMAGDKRVTLRRIPKPRFACSLGLVNIIDYPDGTLEVLCGCKIGQPEAIFGCFHCDCGEETWFAAISNVENRAEHADTESPIAGHETVSAATGAA